MLNEEEKQEILNEYEAAIFAANGAGYAGMTAEQVIRNLIERAEAAEAKLATKEQELAQYVECFEAESARADLNHAKLAELEKQDPYGYVHNLVNPPGSSVAASIFKEENRHYGRPVFTRPAPAVSLAELVPDEVPKDVYQAIYQECGGFVDCAANAQTIWNACRAAILRNIEESK